MTEEYHPDDLLPLSGIQHFLFCRRQWALIQIERQWQENVLTVEGKILHDRVDDPFFTEKRKGVIVARSVPVASTLLGLQGVCDMVEFVPSDSGVQLPGHVGWFLPVPVEYKRGKPKAEQIDEAQLCAQAICLEEMLAVTLQSGYLYYGQTRRRVAVEFTASLRDLVRNAAREMHIYLRRGYTPKASPFPGCHSCSLVDICLPSLPKGHPSASSYIRQQIEGV
jgi:CRISPR-associated exonuclease Cas4